MSPRPEPTARFFAVHNALQTSGMSQLGPVSRGELGAGQAMKLPVDLAGQCVTIMGMAGSGVADLGLVLADPDGKEVAKDETQGPDATVRYCADKPGKYQVTVLMVQGSGEYVVAAWTGGQPTRGSDVTATGATPQTGGGTCDAPGVLVPGQTYVGDTQDGRANEEGTCGNTNARELVYRLDIPTRQRVSIDVRAQYDSVLYLRKGECSDTDAEVECNDDAPGGGRRSKIDRVLEPGAYFVFVDGYGEEEGAFRMTVRTEPAGTSMSACDAAPLLASAGGAVRGAIGDMTDSARASCGREAPGPDRVYRLDVPTRSRVRLTEQATGFAPVLHVRSSCEDRGSEVGCAADPMVPGRVAWGTVLDPGTYWVYADSAVDASVGEYVLTSEVTADVGRATRGDTCGDAESIAAHAGDLTGDTFDARDDLSVSCGSGSGADVVYRLDVLRKARLSARVQGDEGKHRLALQKTCGAPSSELACGTSIEQTLDPGAYWLVVDSADASSFGRYAISYRIQDLAQAEAACASPPRLNPGQMVTATTSGGANRLHVSCAGSADVHDSPDRVYAFTLARRTAVALHLHSPSFPAALAIRRSCTQDVSEVACRTGHLGGSDVIIEKVLDAGTYYAIVDGQDRGSSGDFTLQLRVHRPTDADGQRRPARAPDG